MASTKAEIAMAQIDYMDPFPQGFKPATSGLEHLKYLMRVPVEELIAKLELDQNLCDEVDRQCGDKRYTPSTYVTEVGNSFEVGWFDGGPTRKAVRSFSRRPEAIADYLLFSFGEGRLTV